MTNKTEELKAEVERLQSELTKARECIAQLESGLRIIAVSGKGSTISGLRMVAKQSINKAHQSAPAAKGVCDE